MTQSRARAFTLVELLIVIVVIAILAAISVIAYSGMQVRSANAARYTQVRQVEKLLELYKADKGNYPPITAQGATYCVGTGYPDAGSGKKCRNYTSTTVNFGLETDTTVSGPLSTVGSLPNGGYLPVFNVTVGPYILTFADPTVRFYLFSAFEGSALSECPKDYQSPASWKDPAANRILCAKEFRY